ncbi:hypothetical protein ANSO36C_38690 [Nostoc cf. commune SO-36]|uniref:Glycyl-tRNA synthetase alpha subunit n=1 Tax=Nostoc cf. commune SO-36 TaxID=449208 RepID=A0ABN6Q9H6_NOSCO|nr:hypothetical protein ANSO36C_38690 [Nostoc cf. commune SO-36]
MVYALCQLKDGASVNFQSVITLLHHFWRERGCLIAQPYDIEKGAGTGELALTQKNTQSYDW